MLYRELIAQHFNLRSFAQRNLPTLSRYSGFAGLLFCKTKGSLDKWQKQNTKLQIKLRLK